jgi:Ca-activated chloride channel family protein
MGAIPFLKAAGLALVTATLLVTPRDPRPATEFPPAPVRAVVFTGTVAGPDGAPLPGAQVIVNPWRVGGVTNERGRYRIAVAAATAGQRANITVQMLGYVSVSREVRIAGDSVVADFRLAPAPVELDEIAVTSDRLRREVRIVGMSVAQAAAYTPGFSMTGGRGARPVHNTENYAAIDENPFLAVAANPLSTFSIDVDRASYANVRRFIREGQRPPRDAVRIEELVNYFPYDDAEPEDGGPFAVSTQLAPAPWRPAHKLLRIALKASALDAATLPPSNLVFLIDVSGSMQPPNKLPLLKQAFGLLVNELRPQDRVAMVVYAGRAGLVLESTPGDRKEEILAAIERLEAGGSTAGGAGLRLAYDVAARHHIAGGNNRVILATDGDFNVGESSDAAMTQLVEEKRKQGTFLTVLGFGMGNLKDNRMELLADKGNGNYGYIDDIAEARKLLVEEMGGTLFTVAKDVKLQVEFNPARVRAYRLIGYENRLLAAEDFHDDRKDAGELGAGHSVTALYEVVPVGADTDVEIRVPDSLRYQTTTAPSVRAGSRELAFVKLRYKAPDGDASRLMELPVADRDTRANADFTFSAAVAAFGMVLRDSPHRGSATLESALALARDGLGDDRGGHRAGFIELIDAARRLDPRQR